jgi:hypothetical protein
MSDDPTQPLPEEIHSRLNEHGVYFKKRVLHELRSYEGLKIEGEEVGESFGQTRVADILAFDRNKSGQTLFL